MNRNAGRSAAPRKGGNSIWTGLLVGMLAGVGMAAGIVWYLMKSPSPFSNKEPAKTQSVPAKPAASAAVPVPEKSEEKMANGKPRFEFYKVLTDKPGTTTPPPADKLKPADKSRAGNPEPGKATVHEPQILQAGSFSNVNDAENLKAKLALLGVEANIQPATIPDKGVWYRVRLGPYKTVDEMNHARNFLKQNGVNSTPMHPQ